MHYYGGKNGTQFNFNSDFSGDIIVQNSKGDSLNIDGRDLLELVAFYVQGEKISRIEEMSVEELLLGGK